MSRRLTAALTGGDLAPLPAAAVAHLEALHAPPRLAAHLRAVHDVARHLTAGLAGQLAFDRELVLSGAALHDIGKVRHPEELSGPGHAHEAAGYALLLDRGEPEPLARSARDHASWTRPDIRTEDLLIALADKIWKAKRVPELEDLVIDRLAATDRWAAFLRLDDVLQGLADGADARLAFQAAHPVADGSVTMNRAPGDASS
ncbi:MULTISPECIES: HD domain-containing protein [Catenuloplanes]|uniref:Nucleotidyltransferase with HDIG domain n=1 Tax=Catenuloplanes niger TaxID=587534 RepID=A0AAE3ZXE0_9ACTN|nr:HD domain-containing protein [Catenuloplanes niger]MDR7326600.1 putative nucleotidyltransferase with HDIG domain [Catenuloplanes niger]